MAENWTAIAAEIADAIASVGFTATLLVPGAATGPDYDPTIGAATETPITVIDDQIRRRDAGGAVTETVRVLTMSAAVVPIKGQIVIVHGERLRIGQVMPLAPGGIDLLFDIEIEA